MSLALVSIRVQLTLSYAASLGLQLPWLSTAVDANGGCCGSHSFYPAGHKASTLYNETSEEWADEDDDDDDDDDGASFSGNYLGLGKVPKGKPCFFLGV